MAQSPSSRQLPHNNVTEQRDGDTDEHSADEGSGKHIPAHVENLSEMRAVKRQRSLDRIDEDAEAVLSGPEERQGGEIQQGNALPGERGNNILAKQPGQCEGHNRPQWNNGQKAHEDTQREPRRDFVRGGMDMRQPVPKVADPLFQVGKHCAQSITVVSAAKHPCPCRATRSFDSVQKNPGKTQPQMDIHHVSRGRDTQIIKRRVAGLRSDASVSDVSLIVITSPRVLRKTGPGSLK